jgi:uncharacterized protein YjbI with pentapeptide repeats
MRKTLSNLFGKSDFKTTILRKIEKGKDLSKENFINADLSDITLNDIDLSGLDLTGVIFIGTKFHNVKFIKTILNAAILTDTELYNVDLTGAKLRDADLIGAKMIGVKLNGADLTKTDLTDSDLTDAKLQETIFNETILTGTKFYGANLSHTDLRKVDVTNTFFVPDEFPSNKKLQLTYADLRGCELTGIDLRGANLIGIDLRGANLTDAKLQKTDLTKAKLQELITDMGEKISTNLTGANLTDAGLREANLTGANLTNAILVKTAFVSSILTDANLTGVTLDKTKFLSSILDGTSLNLEQIKETKSKIKGATISFSRYKSPSQTRTKKFVSKLKKISSITKPENCITILIVAHGGVYPNKSIDPNLMANVHLSEMAGGIHINGLFGVVTKPIKPVVNKYDDKIIYTIDSNRATADASLDILYKTYPYLLEKYNLLEGAKCAETFYSIFQDIVYYIKGFYTSIGYVHFPKRIDYEFNSKNYRKYRESFSVFDTYQEKSFSFIPEPYEFCMTKTKNGCSKLIPERARQLTYGITMLQSSVSEDQPYTLAGMSLDGSEYKNAILSNWKRDTERDYWRQKIENRRYINGDTTDYYLLLYDKISNPLDPEGLYNQPDNNKTSILLSQLLRLLKIGMGFTNINIIDYSCNECDYEISNFKRAAIDTKNSNLRLKEYRKLRTTVKNRPDGDNEWDNITKPPFYKIVQYIGKANSDQQKIKRKSKTIKRKSF